ncbi:unnamed protein product [Cuscuta europaea]|uniref:Uncharacterized protein n=1 Tax=Cuscuta europaea TaxID=41803 RepID=A0A9P1E9F5_CUSEU|nr:unnamed protein product [Cuscuta europaea]
MTLEINGLLSSLVSLQRKKWYPPKFPPGFLPPYLRNSLPTNPSSIRNPNNPSTSSFYRAPLPVVPSSTGTASSAPPSSFSLQFPYSSYGPRIQKSRFPASIFEASKST